MAQLAWSHGARSIIEMEEDGCFEFALYPDSQGVACGLNNDDTGTLPTEIKHGFMVLDRKFCIIESGLQRTPWINMAELIEPAYMEGLNGDTLVCRIYRIGGRIIYTAGNGYPGDGTEEDGTDSWYAQYAETHLRRGYLLRGRIIHESLTSSTGTVFIDSAFAAPWEEIHHARLIDLVLATSEINASTPAWRVGAGDVGVFLRTPAWKSWSSDLGGNFALARTPQWQVLAGESIFETPRNEVKAITPAWRTEDPALKTKWLTTPKWKARSAGGGQALAVSPKWYAHGGDNINFAGGVTPAWTAQGMAARPMDGLAYGQVPIFLAFSNYVVDDSLSTSPLVGKLGGSITHFVSAAVVTEPLVGVLGFVGSVFGVSTLATAPMPSTLSGSISGYAESSLGTVTLSGLLGGSIDAISEVTLPAEAFVGILSGDIGFLSQTNEVFSLCMTGDKPGGTTRYTGYEFTSVAEIGGRYYGTRADGLYLLEGNQDAGQAIAASFGFGELNFGSPQLKTVAYCYLGASAGAMRVNISALVNGNPASYTYPARAHGSTMREIRFDLGRGLKSTYVQPTFYNTNGSDFQVDTVQFLVAESARRI